MAEKSDQWGIFRATVPSHFPARILYTSAFSPVDGRDFNFSAVTADRMGQGSVGQERVKSNEQALTHILGRPVVRIHQVHSNRVVDLDHELAGIPEQENSSEDSATAAHVTAAYATAWSPVLTRLSQREADAMVTTRTDCALAILTGDCTPVLCVDPQAKVFGAAHAGRRGVENGVVPHLLDAMQHHGAHAGDIHIWIGPHICGRCYETGEQISDAFDQQFAGCATHTRFGGPGVDMQRALISEMTHAGIDRSHIHDSDPAITQQTRKEAPRLHAAIDPQLARQVGNPSDSHFNALCTLENPLLYSYRRWTLTRQLRSDGRFLNILVPLSA